jgi:hypothetical protein
MLVISSCNSQNTTVKEADNPGNLAETIPFNIMNQLEKIEIDSLLGKALLYLFVSDEGKVVSFNITHLELKDSRGKEVIYYTNVEREALSKDNYSESMKEYYIILGEYLSTLVFEKKEGAKVNKINNFYLNIKIGDTDFKTAE